MTDSDAPRRAAWEADVEATANRLAAMFRGALAFPPDLTTPLTYAQQANEDRAAALGMDRAMTCGDWDDPTGENADRESARRYGP